MLINHDLLLWSHKSIMIYCLIIYDSGILSDFICYIGSCFLFAAGLKKWFEVMLESKLIMGLVLQLTLGLEKLIVNFDLSLLQGYCQS